MQLDGDLPAGMLLREGETRGEGAQLLPVLGEQDFLSWSASSARFQSVMSRKITATTERVGLKAMAWRYFPVS